MSADATLRAALPPELVDRARRERDFFNQRSNPLEVPDEVLRVPQYLDAIPEELGKYMPSLKDKYVCEFGCGYGVIAAYLAQQGARVFAFDVAEANVMVAQRCAEVNGVADRVSVQVMQGECLAYPSNMFDLVLGNAVLHHLDLAASAHEIYRVLKPGGIAIFREPLGENHLLEWARRCPLRSSEHRHTADERSLLYEDVEVLRTVFPQLVFREAELLTVVRALLRRVKVGMIAVAPSGRVVQRLARLDHWMLSRWPAIRPFASYSVISMFKPSASSSAGPNASDAWSQLSA